MRYTRAGIGSGEGQGGLPVRARPVESPIGFPLFADSAQMKEGGAYADYGEEYGGVTEPTCGRLGRWVRSARLAQRPPLL